MLTEFAFTPSIFEEEAHEDKDAWRDQLRELNSVMFPRTSAWPIVVADLYAGTWSKHVISYIKAINDHKAKQRCQDLLTNIGRMLVVRPVCGEWPHEDDAAWCREAIASNSMEPIERILSVRVTKDSCAKEFASVRCIDEVEEGGFWRGIDSNASPPMVIAEQVILLRKLCLHSEWVAFINPHGYGSEVEFSLRLVELALRRDSRFGPVHIELHAQYPDGTDVGQRTLRQEKMANHIVHQMTPHVTGTNRVELYFWPKLLDRILVAGTYAKESNGSLRKRPRWGVSMSHVARGSDPDAAPTEWNLLRPRPLDRWFRQIVAEDASNRSVPTRINPASVTGD